MHRGDMIVESKAFRFILKGAFWTSIVIALIILLMVLTFIFNITFLDYRFDDGEIKPPNETVINNN